jgi:hypothetical protein
LFFCAGSSNITHLSRNMSLSCSAFDLDLNDASADPLLFVSSPGLVGASPLGESHSNSSSSLPSPPPLSVAEMLLQRDSVLPRPARAEPEEILAILAEMISSSPPSATRKATTPTAARDDGLAPDLAADDLARAVEMLPPGPARSNLAHRIASSGPHHPHAYQMRQLVMCCPLSMLLDKDAYGRTPAHCARLNNDDRMVLAAAWPLFLAGHSRQPEGGVASALNSILGKSSVGHHNNNTSTGGRLSSCTDGHGDSNGTAHRAPYPAPQSLPVSFDVGSPLPQPSAVAGRREGALDSGGVGRSDVVATASAAAAAKPLGAGSVDSSRAPGLVHPSAPASHRPKKVARRTSRPEQGEAGRLVIAAPASEARSSRGTTADTVNSATQAAAQAATRKRKRIPEPRSESEAETEDEFDSAREEAPKKRSASSRGRRWTIESGGRKCLDRSCSYVMNLKCSFRLCQRHCQDREHSGGRPCQITSHRRQPSPHATVQKASDRTSPRASPSPLGSKLAPRVSASAAAPAHALALVASSKSSKLARIKAASATSPAQMFKKFKEASRPSGPSAPLKQALVAISAPPKAGALCCTYAGCRKTQSDSCSLHFCEEHCCAMQMEFASIECARHPRPRRTPPAAPSRA